MLDAVGVELGIGDLEIDDGIDLHGDIILGDNGLRRIVQHLFLQADLLGYALDEGNLHVHADLPDLAECAETLNDVGA